MVVPMATVPLGLIVNSDIPVEVLTWNGFKVVVPWTSRETVAEEALTPATVPLSMETPLLKVLAEVHLAK